MVGVGKAKGITGDTIFHFLTNFLECAKPDVPTIEFTSLDGMVWSSSLSKSHTDHNTRSIRQKYIKRKAPGHDLQNPSTSKISKWQ